MTSKEKIMEAEVHFELYRLLRNNKDEYQSKSIQYETVIPEHSIKNKAIDLVIEAKKGNSTFPFVAIEVKKRTMGSHLLYNPESIQQIEGYTRELNPFYSILTDGHVLRLFSKNELLGNYKLELNDKSVRQLLKELLELHDRKRQTLSFPKARSLDAEEIAREKEKLAKALLEVMEFVKKEERFKLKTKLTQKNRIRYLSVCSLKVLVLGLQLEVKEIEKDQSYIHVELSQLRNKVGMETLRELLERLKKIPTFEWVNPTVANQNEDFIWKNLKDMRFENESELASTKKQLTKWLIELSNLIC